MTKVLPSKQTRYLPMTLFSSLLILLSSCSQSTSNHQPSPTTHAQPQCELRLSQKPATESTRPSDVEIEIYNTGNDSVRLVMPGDGSAHHWRTPLTGWSILPANSTQQHPSTAPRSTVGRCGNVNPLKPEEVFDLPPGESRKIGSWCRMPSRTLSPGKYRACFYYTNAPDLKGKGLPLAPHDSEAKRLVRASTPITLISNEIEFEIAQ